jgi:hypothetical protein
MTIPEVKEIIKESEIWPMLSPADKIEVLEYVAERADEPVTNQRDPLEISDIIAEMFKVRN